MVNHMVQQAPAAPAIELDRIFHALADPTRRDLLSALALGEHTVSQLAEPFAMSLTAVSKHLRVLEAAHLVERERRGREQRCRLAPEALSEAWHWIGSYRQFWNDRLDALDAYLTQAHLTQGRRKVDG